VKEFERQSEEMINDMGIRLVLTMMASAPHDKIKALDWWPRAKSALETAADAASCWPQMISKMSAKLQIDATTIATANEIRVIGEQVGTGEMFERFRSICRRDAVFIVAMSQARRDEQRQTKATYKDKGLE
jgi:hypothetical protein